MLSTGNIVILVLFFTLCFLTAVYFSKGKPTLGQYFLAKNQFGWFVIGFVAFTTNTAISTFINIGSWAYRDGLVAFNFELTGIFSCVILSLFFSKIYYANNIFTTSEFIEKRYSKNLAYITSFLLIFMYVVSRVSVVLLCNALIINYFLGIDIYTSSIILVIFCGSYSIIGGQRTVILNGFILGWVMMIGTLLLTYFVWKDARLVEDPVYPQFFWNFLRPIEAQNFTWPHIVIAMPIIGVWYHCVNQELVQKFMSAKNEYHFQAGALLHGYLKLLVFPIVILPGILAYKVCSLENSEALFSSLIFSFVPKYLIGTVLCAFLASSMVSLSASFNACSTLFTFDFYRKRYPNANDFVLMNIGKIAIIVIVIISMVWVVLLQSFSDSIFIFVSSVLTYFTPPFAVIFLAGIFWARATPKAAFVTLVSGILIGLFKFILSVAHEKEKFTQEVWVYIAEFNFFNFCSVLFLFNTVTLIVVSVLDIPQKREEIEPLLFKFPKLSKLPASERKFQQRIYWAAGILVVSIVMIYGIVG